jgi:dihydroflavonol-4-reductase
MILVTGGTGFIGSHLLETLGAQGEAARCLLRRSSSRNLPFSGAELVYGDLISGEGIEAALRGADVVMHLAGVTKALKADDYYAGNARATENLARAVAGAKVNRDVRLVYVSSLAAIGASLDGTPVSEDGEPHPITHYGKSKLLGEQAVRALVPDAVIVRPAVVYGSRDTDVLQILKSISNGWMVQIAGGERWFQAIYVKDLVEGMLAAARSPQASGRSYFLAHPKTASWSELSSVAARIMHKQPRMLRSPQPVAYAAGFCAEAWARIARKPGIISREKVREAQCQYWTCDTQRATEELGFTAKTPLETGLAETLAWYKEAGWLKY